MLYFLGSGPVQGFAVTLALGILTSLFTSYTVTLFFVGIWYRWRRPKTLKIQHFRFIPDGTKIPFMKISRYVDRLLDRRRASPPSARPTSRASTSASTSSAAPPS